MKKQRTEKQRVGDLGEQYAVNHLRLHGYTVRERNWRSGHDELDVIATTFRTIAFVEVKTRSYVSDEVDTLPPPGRAVNAEKQRVTRRAARQYLFEHPTKKHPRMDVIEVWLENRNDGKKPKLLRIRHIKGAY